MEVAVQRVESWLNSMVPGQTQKGIPGREVENFMPSSHTYPVAAGKPSAATFPFCVAEDTRKSHGSIRWNRRCPKYAPSRLKNGYSAHLVSPHPDVPLAIYFMQFQEFGRYNLKICRQAFRQTVWGVTPGHLFPPRKQSVPYG